MTDDKPINGETKIRVEFLEEDFNELKVDVKDIHKKVDTLIDRIGMLATEVAVVRVKAGIWGTIGAGVTTIIVLLVYMFRMKG